MQIYVRPWENDQLSQNGYDAKCARNFHFRDRAKIAELYLLSLFIRLIEYRSRGNVWKPNSLLNQVFAFAIPRGHSRVHFLGTES